RPRSVFHAVTAASIQQSDRGRRVLAAAGQFLELVDGVDLGAHGDVGHALQDHFDHHRYLVLGHPGLGLFDGRAQIFLLEHADRLAAQALDHRDVVDAVAFHAALVGIDVLEAQLHAVIHLEAALRLANQPQVGVVHQDVDVGQFELRTHCQLLDHELEVIVARERHDLARRVRRNHAERRRNGPAERAGLAAVDPVARLVDMQKLRGGDLRQTDGADVAGVLAERVVHTLVHALRLHRHAVEVRLAQHCALALLAVGGPGRAVRQLAGGLALLGDFDEQLQRGARIGSDAVVRREHPTDLGWFDIHVYELAVLGVNLDRTGVAVGPAVADTEHEVRGQHVGVTVAMAGLQTAHAGHQRMVIGDRTPAHQGRDYRHADGFGELDQQLFGAGVVNAATGDDQRALGGAEHVDGFLDLLAAGCRLVDRERLVGVDVEFDFGHLHVERQVDQHRTGTARAHHVEGLLEHARHQCRLAYGDGP